MRDVIRVAQKKIMRAQKNVRAQEKNTVEDAGTQQLRVETSEFSRRGCSGGKGNLITVQNLLFLKRKT